MKRIAHGEPKYKGGKIFSCPAMDRVYTRGKNCCVGRCVSIRLQECFIRADRMMRYFCGAVRGTRIFLEIPDTADKYAVMPEVFKCLELNDKQG